MPVRVAPVQCVPPLPVHPGASPSVIYLVAGAGGIAEGFRHAGFKSIAATDIDPDAHATFDRIFPDAVVVRGDLRAPSTKAQLLEADSRADLAKQQHDPFADQSFPEPGADPAIVEIVRDVLGPRLVDEPSALERRRMTQRIRELIAVENKRKHLVGEGFEDVLGAVIRAFDAASALDVRARCLLPEVPGSANTRVGDKANRVDVAVVHRSDQRRTIVTAKWSIRADC